MLFRKRCEKVYIKLEDLKRSPDLLNNVIIGHGHLQLIMKHFFFVPEKKTLKGFLQYIDVVVILVM